MNAKRYFIRTLVAGMLVITCSWLAVPVHAVDPSELLPVEIGKPARIEVHPGSIKLTSSRQFRQLVVTAHYANGQLQDITRVAEIVSSNPQVAEVEKGIVRPRGDGTSELLIKAGGQEVKVAV